MWNTMTIEKVFGQMHFMQGRQIYIRVSVYSNKFCHFHKKSSLM